MDFDLSDEQLLLKEAVSRWAGAAYPSLDAVQAARAAPLGFSAARWRELAELGVLALPFAEADGGFGGGPVETQLVMEALGRALAPEPYLASVVLGGAALRLAANAAQREALIAGLIEGEQRLAFAHAEAQARYDLNDVAATATREGAGWRLDGAKSVVLNADAATTLIVSARSGGARRDAEGITLFLAPADAPGVTIRAYPTQDGGRAADVTLDGVRLGAEAALGQVGAGLPIVERVVEQGVAALAAEAVGLMEALLALTVDYLKTRKQFGVPIGTFQSLQHKAVDMFVALEQARSMALYAAMAAQGEDAGERRLGISAAKTQINKSARFVGQTAVQLHGGVGMTMEYLGAHMFRRLSMIELTFGDTPWHLRRVAQAGGLTAAE